MDLAPIDETDLTGEVPQRLFVRVSELVKRLAPDNPKVHDIGGITESFIKHGYKGGVVYDLKQGFVTRGNGRVEVLDQMERGGLKRPRGVAEDAETGDWVIAVDVGIDAETLAGAYAFLVDDNHLVLSGGNFELVDYLDLWEPGIGDVLTEIAEEGDLLASLDPEDIDDVMAILGGPKEKNADAWRYLSIFLPPTTITRYRALRDSLGADDEKTAFEEILDAAEGAL